MPEDSKIIFTASQIFSWFRKGGLVMLDQALFSGGNFLVSILLARWLTAIQYGAYAVVFSIFLLIGTFHTSFFTEPMLVFGAGKYRERFPAYLTILNYGHALTMIPLIASLLILAFFTGKLYSIHVQKALVGLAFASPFMLFLWILRRAFYIQSRPFKAVVGGALYLIFCVLIMYILKEYRTLSQTTAYISMGLSGLIVCVFFINMLRPRLEKGGSPTINTVAIAHWDYGKWAAASSSAAWIPANIFFMIIPFWAGLQGAAILKVIMNIGSIAMVTNSALATYLIPVLSRYRTESKKKMIAVTKFFIMVFIIGNVVYFLVLYFFPRETLKLCYGNKYGEFYYLVPLAGLLAVPTCISAVLASFLRASELPNKLFLCIIPSVIITLVGCIPLVAIMGVTGAMLGIFLSSAIIMIALLFSCIKVIQGSLIKCL